MSGFNKSYPVKDKAALEQFAVDQQRCACCWIGVNPFLSRKLEIHHLIKQGRSDERCNLLRLCNECHRLAEMESIRENGDLLPKLTLGMCLWLKLESDYGHHDLRRLTELYHKRLPECELLPDEHMDRRNKNRRFES